MFKDLLFYLIKPSRARITGGKIFGVPTMNNKMLGGEPFGTAITRNGLEPLFLA